MPTSYYLRVHPIPEDTPVTSAYRTPLAVLPPPIGGGREVDDNDFKDFHDNNETEDVELVATNDAVVILRNVRRQSDACA